MGIIKGAEPSGVFVYGTLKRGERNHPLVADASRIIPATTRGTLYDLPVGYPCMTVEGDDTVHGEFMTFKDLPGKLARLDRLEGYREGRPAEENLYLRVPLHVTLESGGEAKAWGYIFTRARANMTPKERVPSGEWHGKRYQMSR